VCVCVCVCSVCVCVVETARTNALSSALTMTSGHHRANACS